MEMEEELKIERYKLVTDRQKYFTELSRNAFASYIKIFTGLIAGAITIISAKAKLGLEPKLLIPIIDGLVYLVSFLGLLTILQIIFCLARWKGYRRAECKINPDSPKVKSWWWLFEGLYCLAILISIIAAWVLWSDFTSVIASEYKLGQSPLFAYVENETELGVTEMTYTQQIIATLIGTFVGFIGSLTLFWIKEWSQKKKQQKSLVEHLLYEFDYNISLLSKYEADLSKCIEAINADSRSVFTTVQYDKIARYFSIQFYREGLVMKYLHPEDVKNWNDFLSSLGEGAEAYILDTLEKWRDSNIDKQKAFKAIEHERNHVEYARKMCEYLKAKIAS